MRLALLLSLLVAAPLAARQGTHLVLLGTGTPNPDPEHSGPATAVVVNGTAYLVDAGAGVMRRAEQARRKYDIPALDAARIGIVFLTHLHSDHTIGLPDVIHTGWVLGRENPLVAYGPPGTARMARLLTDAWRDDIRVRSAGRQPHTENGWKVDAHDIALAGVVYRDSNVTVTAFRVPHPGWEYAYGYRFDTPDMHIVISGDTGPGDAAADACHGCDILLHEVYSAEGLKRRSPEWQAYHRSAHTSTVELAGIATRAHPGLLVLYHQIFMGASDQDLVNEIHAAGYSGRVVSGADLDIFPPTSPP